MKQKIVINCDSKLTRVALLENNKVAEIYFERPLHQRLVGNIYKGWWKMFFRVCRRPL